MSRPSQATVTAKIGPGRTLTAQKVANITNVTIDLAGRSYMQLKDSEGRIREFDVHGASTITLTISAGVGTLTVT